MAVKINIDYLELEITRRCNAKCLHCMRGNPENFDMTSEIIKNIFKNDDHEIKRIDELFITGGEPFLAKNSLIYLLEYLLNNNLNINVLSLITNSLLYDEDIIKLLKILNKRDVEILISSYQDQFHPEIPDTTFKAFASLPFYLFQKEFLTNEKIVYLGRAIENNLGIPSKSNFWENSNDFLTINHIDPKNVDIDSIYVTATGKFGARPDDASWKMIDEKYKLDIKNDSIFTNCKFDSTFEKVIENIKTFQIPLLTKNFIEDYYNALKNNCLDLFYYSLTEEQIRNYLVYQNEYTRKLNL